MTVPVLSFAPGAGDVVVDLERLLPSRLLITGDPGSGKSRIARQLLEQTAERIPQLILDPEGEYATLREQFDHLLVGPGGELPADPASAPAVALRLFRLHASAILDLSELKPRAQRAFVAAFCAALIEAPRELAHPTLVLVDEAQTLAPEGVRDGEGSTEALADLAGRGRKRGLCVVAVAQRLSELSKTFAGKLVNKVVLATALDSDQERAGKALGFSSSDRRKLGLLPVGEAYAYGVAIGDGRTVYHVRAGAIRTTHPDATRRGAIAPPPAPAAVQAMVRELQDLATQEAEEARTVEQLRARVRELESAPPVHVLDADRLAAEYERGRVDGAEAECERHQRRLPVVIRALRDAGGQIAEQLARLAEEIEAETLQAPAARAAQLSVSVPVRGDLDRAYTVRHEPQLPNPAPRPATRDVDAHGRRVIAASVRQLAQDNGAPVPGEQRILDALAELVALGIQPASRKQVGILARLTLTAGAGSRYVTGLVRRALVETPAPGMLELTAEGRAAATPVTRPLSRREIQQRAHALLDADGEHRILDQLLARYPAAASRAELGEVVGLTLTAGAGSRYVTRLVQLELAEIPKPGMLRASEYLFPKGLR